MSARKFLELPATSSCTLGSSPVMVICDRWAGWSGPLQSSRTIVRAGLALDLEALGPEDRVLPNVPIDGIFSKETCHSLDTL